MKIKNLYIVLVILATAFFVGCSEYEDTVEPSPTVSADNPAARFYINNQVNFELDPNQLFLDLTVIRSGGSGASEIPVFIVSDTSSVFSAPSTVTFPAGVDTVTLTVSMSSSAIAGVVYGFELGFDENSANPYKMDYSTYYGKAAISIWENVGITQFYDSFSLYSVAEVTMWKNTQDPNMVRISFPYSEGILLDAEWEGWIGGKTQEKIVYTISGENVTWDKFWYTNLLYQGNDNQEIKAYLPSAIGKDGDIESVVVKDGAGNILYFELMPSIYIDGVGGWGLNAVYVGMPGFDLAGALGLPVFVE